MDWTPNMDNLNPFTVLFCWAPIGFGVVLPALYILSHIAAMKAKADESRAREADRKQTMELKEQAAAQRAAMHEMQQARLTNNVVLQDARLEAEAAKLELIKLKIRKEMREQGLTAQPFTPDEFTPKQ